MGVLGIFKLWQTEKKSFTEVFEREKAGFTDSILSGVERDREQAAKLEELLARLGTVPPSIARYSATMNTPFMLGLHHLAQIHLMEQDGNYHSPGRSVSNRIIDIR